MAENDGNISKTTKKAQKEYGSQVNPVSVHIAYLAHKMPIFGRKKFFDTILGHFRGIFAILEVLLTFWRYFCHFGDTFAILEVVLPFWSVK